MSKFDEFKPELDAVFDELDSLKRRVELIISAAYYKGKDDGIVEMHAKASEVLERNNVVEFPDDAA